MSRGSKVFRPTDLPESNLSGYPAPFRDSQHKRWNRRLGDHGGLKKVGAEIGTRVAAAMSELSPLERAAFTLRHYEGRSIDEISRTLGLRTSAAKHGVFRAVRKLRTALAPLK